MSDVVSDTQLMEGNTNLFGVDKSFWFGWDITSLIKQGWRHKFQGGNHV